MIITPLCNSTSASKYNVYVKNFLSVERCLDFYRLAIALVYCHEAFKSIAYSDENVVIELIASCKAQNNPALSLQESSNISAFFASSIIFELVV